MCICSWQSLVILRIEMTLCGWQDVKIQVLTGTLHAFALNDVCQWMRGCRYVYVHAWMECHQDWTDSCVHGLWRGMEEKMQAGLKKLRICKCFHVQASWSGSIDGMFNFFKDLFASNLSSTGHSHVGSLFASEEQKSLSAPEVHDIFTTHDTLVHEVTRHFWWTRPKQKKRGGQSENLLCLVFLWWCGGLGWHIRDRLVIDDEALL